MKLIEKGRALVRRQVGIFQTLREKFEKWSNPMTKTALAQIQEYIGKRRNAPSRVRLGKRGLATWQRRVA